MIDLVFGNGREWLHPVVQIAKEAGETIVAYTRCHGKELQIRRKSDNTVVTGADLAAHQLIASRLKELSPDLPLLSEEETPPVASVRCSWKTYWLVDPLDGTDSFLQKSKEFTVNIALIEDNKPLIGVIYDPTTKTCYFAGTSMGAFKQVGDKVPQPLRASVLPNPDQVRVLMGQYVNVKKFKKFFTHFSAATLLRLNSSLKFCWLAEGLADCYPALGKSAEWDIAAGDCILQEAGGAVVDLNNQSMQYNTRVSLRNPPFMAMGDPRYAGEFASLLREVESNY